MSCKGLVSGDSTPVAVQVVAPPDSIHVGDTVTIEVHVLNRSGDSIPGAPIALFALTPDTAVGIDSARQAVVGLKVGSGSVVAKTGSLPSQPFLILVK